MYTNECLQSSTNSSFLLSSLMLATMHKLAAVRAVWKPCLVCNVETQRVDLRRLGLSTPGWVVKQCMLSRLL